MSLDDLTRSLSMTMEASLTRIRGRFEKLVGQLDVLSPLATLSRGYSILSRLRDGKIILSTKDVAPGEETSARLTDGRVYSRVLSVERETPEA
jgi:exodeoxyribonuclease VII large subunit